MQLSGGELSARDAPVFREQIDAAVRSRPAGAAVHVYTADEYRRMRMFLSDTGSNGLALNDDEIVSVFSTGVPRQVGQSLMAVAVAAGGRRLDCFDTVLTGLYSRCGFTPVARMRWNDEYAPTGWDYAFFSRSSSGGRPDVVFMRYTGRMTDTPDFSAAPYVDDYDDGVRRAQLPRD